MFRYARILFPLRPTSVIPASSPAFFVTAPPTPAIYTLSLHDALPISNWWLLALGLGRYLSECMGQRYCRSRSERSEEHTSELQSLRHLVCRLLLEKKKQVGRAAEEASHLRPGGGTQVADHLAAPADHD